MKDNKRNGKIELLRLVAAISIAIYHFEWVYIGNPIYFQHFYIWVEFFFVISGFFLAMHASREGTCGSIEYVSGQVKKLYPLYVIGFIFSFAVVNCTSGVLLKQWIDGLWRAKWEILLCAMWGFDNSSVVYNGGGAPTYISTLLICSFVLYYLISKHKEFFVCVLCPIVVIGGLGRIINNYGNLSQWMAWDGLFNSGNIRGMVDMSVGAIFALVVLPRLKQTKNIWMLRVCGIFLPIVCIVGLVVARNQITYNDLIIYIFVFALLISTLSALPEVLPDRMNEIAIYGGKISFPIFLFHYGVLLLLKFFMPSLEYGMGIAICMIVTIVMAMLALKIESMLRGDVKKVS